MLLDNAYFCCLSPSKLNPRLSWSCLYNSLIYLNDDFKGGEFFTRNGIKLKPQAGMLTLFDGSKVSHGLKKVKNKDRKTMIFWWANN